ncbi:unnamed protein product [Spirodela intermedia]|uniref:Uncharacterized protein n=1 Tax=Spirodela intermedia TaxID=51605 RepID=A0ABN7E8P7_SPIIN|nr:unnamed protein product [Spirodela intermedia]
MADMGSHDKKKRKRAKKGARDLRFQDLELAGGQRKQKRKEARNSESSEFPGRQEEIGDVVDAPPKLSFPKGLKTALDASTERRRLQAIEAYSESERMGINTWHPSPSRFRKGILNSFWNFPGCLGD